MLESQPVSLDELLWAVTLQAVDLVEVSGRRRTADDPAHVGAPTTNLQVGATKRAEVIVVNGGVDIATNEAMFRVRAQASFASAEPIEVADEVMRSFVEQTGVTTLHPFLREAVRDLSGRIGVAPTVMDLLQPGQLRLDISGTERS